jgi:hypothetical protein
MPNNQPVQCDICFQSFGPFFAMRILPLSPTTTLSGTAIPIHARIPGARKIICHYCRSSYSNIELWTEPEEALSPVSPALEVSTQPAVCDDELPDHNEQPIISSLLTTRLSCSHLPTDILSVCLSTAQLLSVQVCQFCQFCQFRVPWLPGSSQHYPICSLAIPNAS